MPSIFLFFFFISSIEGFLMSTRVFARTITAVFSYKQQLRKSCEKNEKKTSMWTAIKVKKGNQWCSPLELPCTFLSYSTQKKQELGFSNNHKPLKTSSIIIDLFLFFNFDEYHL